MEDLIFKSEVAFDLSAVEEKAQRSGYQVQYKHLLNAVFLDIEVSEPPHWKQWQWVKASDETLDILSQ